MRVVELAEERARVVAQLFDRVRDVIAASAVVPVILHSWSDPSTSAAALASAWSRGDEPLQVARKVLDAVIAHAEAEVLRRDVLELMRFVDNRVAASGDDFAEGVLTHGQVGAQQVMIDDNHVGRRRALAHARHEAVVVPRTLGAEARFGGRRDFAPERKILRQIVELRPVTGLGSPRPFADDRQKDVSTDWGGSLVELIEAMQAQIVRAPLHVGRREGDAERVAQCGDVLEENLLLQGFRARRDEHALTAQKRGDEIGQRLPGAGSRLREEDAAPFEHSRDGGRHFDLPRTRLEIRHRADQFAIGGKRRDDAFAERGLGGRAGLGACYSG